MAAKKQPVVSSEARKASEAARSAILKTMKQRPLGAEEKQWPHLPSGSFVVDNLIGGSIGRDGKPVCPGIPRRRITEIYGPESSGKTTLALSVVRETQKAGGSVLYLDYEHALHIGYAKAIGVSFSADNFSLFAPDTLEDGFKMIYIAIISGIDLIVVDSVAAMVPSTEIAKSFGDAARVGEVSRLMSLNLPKFAGWLANYPKVGGGVTGNPDPSKLGSSLLLLNQERAVIQTGGGGGGVPEANTTGGKALKFYTSVRLRLTKIKSEIIQRKDPVSKRDVRQPYGSITQVKVVKDKLDGRQGHTGQIFIRYGFGVDNFYSVIESAIAHSIMRREGAYYSYGGQRVQGRDRFRQYLLENPKVCTELEGKLRHAIVASVQPVADAEIDGDTSLVLELQEEFGGGEGIGVEVGDSPIEDLGVEETEDSEA
jgi:recombination protein RecA